MDSVNVIGTANAVLQNKINVSVVFNYLRETGPSYRAKISHDLGLSAPAVSRAIENLVEGGYVIEKGVELTEKGKRAPVFSVNAEKGYVVAVDLLAEKVKLAVCDFAGAILADRDGFSFTEKTDVAEELSADIRALLGSLRKRKRLPGSRLMAISIGVPATTDFETASIVSSSLYASLEGSDLAATLKKRFKVPVFIENITNLSTIAEQNYGIGKGHRNFVFVDIGNGIGSGLVLNGELYRGMGGAAGELGFCLTSRRDLARERERRGFLESQASLDAFVRSAREAIKLHPESLLATLSGADPAKIDSSLVFSAAGSGDRIARDIVRNGVDHLAVAISNVVMVLNPELIVIGGDMTRLEGVEAHVVEPLQRALAAVTPFAPPPVVLSVLRERAGIMGASKLAIDTMLLGKYPYRIQF